MSRVSDAGRYRRWRLHRRRGTDSRGTATVELTMLVPVMVLLLALMAAGARLWFARTTVVEAAQTSARAASLARTATEASREGAAAGRASLDTGGLRCRETSVQIRTAAFQVAVGTPATVRSSVSCRVPLADLLVPGLPGSVTVRADGAAALDTYRSRG